MISQIVAPDGNVSVFAAILVAYFAAVLGFIAGCIITSRGHAE